MTKHTFVFVVPLFNMSVKTAIFSISAETEERIKVLTSAATPRKFRFGLVTRFPVKT